MEEFVNAVMNDVVKGGVGVMQSPLPTRRAITPLNREVTVWT